MVKKGLEKFPFARVEVEALPPRQGKVLTMLFGLPTWRASVRSLVGYRLIPADRRYTLSEVGDSMGVTNAKVAKIRDQALLRLAQNRQQKSSRK